LLWPFYRGVLIVLLGPRLAQLLLLARAGSSEISSPVARRRRTSRQPRGEAVAIHAQAYQQSPFEHESIDPVPGAAVSASRFVI